jgi:hypothetical protein
VIHDIERLGEVGVDGDRHRARRDPLLPPRSYDRRRRAIGRRHARKTRRTLGTPAAASGSMPLARPHGAALSAINRTSTPRSLARINAPTIPEPTVRR